MSDSAIPYPATHGFTCVLGTRPPSGRLNARSGLARQIRNLLTGNDEENEDQNTGELIEMSCVTPAGGGIVDGKEPGQIGFFHLTLEEYLAAVDMARKGMEERRRRLKEHWANPAGMFLQRKES